MTLAEALETTRLHRVAGLTGARTMLVTTRPFRAPHHTISDVGLVGGGHGPMPGEVSPAHNGVLFPMNCPSSGAMSWRSYASRSRRVLQEYHFASFSDLVTLARLAGREGL